MEAFHQVEEGESQADLLEFRLDLFPTYDLETLRGLRKKSKLPLIFTLRQKKEITHWQAKIRELAELSPDYLDIEYDSSSDFAEKIGREFPHIKIILSYHDFLATPSDLPALLQRMQKRAAYLYKISCRANSTNDSLRMLDLIHTHPNLLGMCMGEKGEVTRILAPLMGSPWVYAYIDQKSAEGQLSVEELRSIYSIHRLKSKCLIYGLIGGSIKNSPSHYTHNKVLVKQNINAVYVKMAVETSELEEFFSLAKKIGIRGLSVTMPLKEQIISFLDYLDPEAKNIGAVNTILFQEGRLLGYNTDGKGALDAIEAKVKVQGLLITVVGAGGSARAIVHEALQRGAKVQVVNRTQEKAAHLASLFAVSAGDLNHLSDYAILINTTPSSLPIASTAIQPGKFVMDINTFPKTSSLLREAAEKNCVLLFGYEMFINQALRQFELWFNAAFDRQAGLKSLQEEVY